MSTVLNPSFRITQDSPTADEETIAEWFTITGENLVDGEEYKFLINEGFKMTLTSEFPVYQEGAFGPSINVDGDVTIPISISRGSTTDTFTVYDINGVELPAGYSADFDFTIIDADGSGDPAPAPTPEPIETEDPIPSFSLLEFEAPESVFKRVQQESEVSLDGNAATFFLNDVTPYNVQRPENGSVKGGPNNLKDPSFDSSRDWFKARSSGDTYGAGAGSDIIQAGAGNDTILAGGGRDIIIGGGGKDLIVDGGSHDLISGGSGDDFFELCDGHNTIVDYEEGDKWAIRGVIDGEFELNQTELGTLLSYNGQDSTHFLNASVTDVLAGYAGDGMDAASFGF